MNTGKSFEQDFQKSAEKQGIYVLRLKDCAGWAQDGQRRFTPSNPFDFLIYLEPTAMALELKSRKTSLRFDEVSDVQMRGLAHAYSNGVDAGVLVNFRKYEKTYYLPIYTLRHMRVELAHKKSFNADDASQAGAVLLLQERKITRYTYNVMRMIQEVRQEL